jgi:hypothetical protein
MSVKEGAQPRLILRRYREEGNSISELRMKRGDNRTRANLLLIEPKYDVQFGPDLQRERGLHIATTQAEVTGLQTHWHVRTVGSDFDLDSYLDAQIPPPVWWQDTLVATPGLCFDHSSIVLPKSEKRLSASSFSSLTALPE